MTATEPQVKLLRIDWSSPTNTSREWLGAWLVDHEGVEGDIFYDGEGSGSTEHEVPPGVVGFRLRCWEQQSDEGVVQRLPVATKPYYFDTQNGTEVAVRAADLLGY